MSVELQRRLFTVDEYHAMARAGVFGEDDRLELIEGEIVEVAAIGSRHAACVKRLIRLLVEKVADRAVIGAQDPVRLSDLSEPEPDVSVLRPREDFYESAHPGPEDVLLIVEVADSSIGIDRHVKVPLYARAGVPEVWLVDLSASPPGEGAAADGDASTGPRRASVEVFRASTPEGYAESERFARDDVLRPEKLSGVEIPLREVVGS